MLLIAEFAMIKPHSDYIYWCYAVELVSPQLHQPRLWFFTGGYLVKRWFIPAAARARGQSNDLNWEILASNLFNCHKEVINAPPVPSISRCIHIVYRHKNVWEYQWSNFIYNCMSTFLHYVHCKDALHDCSAPGGERCESLTWVDEIEMLLMYTTKIRPVLEYACAAWHPGLTQYLTDDIERVQIRAMRIIFPGLSYGDALVCSQLPTLKDRRNDICLRFFKSMEKSDHKLHHLFSKFQN